MASTKFRAGVADTGVTGATAKAGDVAVAGVDSAAAIAVVAGSVAIAGVAASTVGANIEEANTEAAEVVDSPVEVLRRSRRRHGDCRYSEKRPSRR